MANTTSNEKVIANPTYMADIRHFFNAEDISHMRCKKIELGTYDGVKANAASIYAQTAKGHMPPGNDKWSSERVQTFLNWIVASYPLGSATPQNKASLAQAVKAGAERVRKDITKLSNKELDQLKAAFTGMMKRDPSDPESYFALAGTHWYPAINIDPTFHCLHHENRYNPWHRIYLKKFEDAMRSVPGCENVTLPYWDITAPVPAVLYEKPFASYTAQATVAPEYPNFKTTRNDAKTVDKNISKKYAVPSQITQALKQTVWETFDSGISSAHDSGHSAIGPTMSNQDVAAFDPIFWFFHANWDRLWLDWQQRVGATTLETFTTTCSGPTIWLTLPPLNALPPFFATADKTIFFPQVAYAPPKLKPAKLKFENMTGNVAAASVFKIDKTALVSVRVKNIDRSKIPGTFDVHLLADGQIIARRAFFQPTKPAECMNCSENALINIDFRLAQDELHGRKLGIEIHVPSHVEEGTKFPLSSAGNPTINARLLLQGE